MLLVVGLVAVSGVALFAPLMTCEECDGSGNSTPMFYFEDDFDFDADLDADLEADPDDDLEDTSGASVSVYCSPCSGEGKVPLLNIWSRE